MFARFQQWLKKSGVKYTSPDEAPLDSELIDSLNILEEVIEHPAYSMAKIHRNSILVGILDTFDVIVGDHYDHSKKGHGRKGVLDLLIFPIISRRLMDFALRYENNNSQLLETLSTAASITSLVLELARHTMGGVLTLAVTPVVVTVHGLSYLKQKKEKYKEKINHLEVVSENEINQNNETFTFDHLLNPRIVPVMKLSSNEEKNEPVLSHLKVYSTSYFHHEMMIKLDEEKNRDGIKALLATNTGCILENLAANPPAFQKLHQWLTFPPKESARNTFLKGENAAAPIKTAFFKSKLFEPKVVPLIFEFADIAASEKPDESKKNRRC